MQKNCKHVGHPFLRVKSVNLPFLNLFALHSSKFIQIIKVSHNKFLRFPSRINSRWNNMCKYLRVECIEFSCYLNSSMRKFVSRCICIICMNEFYRYCYKVASLAYIGSNVKLIEVVSGDIWEKNYCVDRLLEIFTIYVKTEFLKIF